MPAPKFVQAKPTTLAVSITAAETSEIKLKNFLDVYGNELAMANFGTTGYITIDPGGESEEIVSFTGFTVNDDGTVSIDTGITRGISAISPYGAGGTATAHAAGVRVVTSNNPQLYDAIIDYVDSVSIAGGASASTTSQGYVEVATQAEIDADTETGSTGAYLSIDPATLATSKYGTRLPTQSQYYFIAGVTGMIVPYGGASAPTGFLLCDGSSYNIATYNDLSTVLLGRYGLDSGTAFTSDYTTDTLTSNAHGLENGDIVFVNSSTTLPGGLSENTIYYVVNKSVNTFQLSTSLGGSEVSITNDGTGTHQFYTQFKVPDLRASMLLGKGAKSYTEAVAYTAFNTTTGVITVADASTTTGTAVTLTTSGTMPGAQSGTSQSFAIDGSGYFTGNIVNDVRSNGQTVTINTQSSTSLGLTTYYVIDFNGTTFRVSTTPGGSAAATGNAGTGTATAQTVITAGATYYVIRSSYNTIKLATTADNATAGYPIYWYSQGTGTHTIAFSLSTRTLGDSGGVENVTLNEAQIPAHTHGLPEDNGSGSAQTLTGANLTGGYTTTSSSTGGGQPHDNMPPYVVVNYIIKT